MHRQHETVTQVAPIAERLQMCFMMAIIGMALFASGVAVGFYWGVML